MTHQFVLLYSGAVQFVSILNMNGLVLVGVWRDVQFAHPLNLAYLDFHTNLLDLIQNHIEAIYCGAHLSL